MFVIKDEETKFQVEWSNGFHPISTCNKNLSPTSGEGFILCWEFLFKYSSRFRTALSLVTTQALSSNTHGVLVLPLSKSTVPR